VSAHLLVDDAGLTLIDTGLWGVPGQVRRAVARLGRRREELREVVLLKEQQRRVEVEQA
jgi:hypothetical protein